MSIKGPLTTPVGGGIRSLNVALRQLMDLYQCVRPVKYYAGVPSPQKHPELVDIVIFRENTEDIYAGIEFREGTPEVAKFIAFVNDDMLKGGQEEDSARLGCRCETDLDYRVQAPGAGVDSIRDRQRPQDRNAGA